MKENKEYPESFLDRSSLICPTPGQPVDRTISCNEGEQGIIVQLVVHLPAIQWSNQSFCPPGTLDNPDNPSPQKTC